MLLFITGGIALLTASLSLNAPQPRIDGRLPATLATYQHITNPSLRGPYLRSGFLVKAAEARPWVSTDRTCADPRTSVASGAMHTLTGLRFRWPVYGPISSGFGAPRPPRGTRRHAGIDIGVRQGTAIRAPADGTVVFVGWRSGYGKTVVVDHGHWVRTLYGHLSRSVVKSGQMVPVGTALGLTGATGHASGPHLHYEVLVNDRPVNPGLVAPASPHAVLDAVGVHGPRQVTVEPCLPPVFALPIPGHRDQNNLAALGHGARPGRHLELIGTGQTDADQDAVRLQPGGRRQRR